jgi:hypothetical protein
MQRFGRGIAHGAKKFWHTFGDNIKDGVGMIPGIGESLRSGIDLAEDTV